jgi:hypothetical protein
MADPLPLGCPWSGWTPPNVRPFFIGLALLVAAAAFSLADVTRAFCDPANHWLQGHAIWHVLTAASLYAMFRFYERLEYRAAS